MKFPGAPRKGYILMEVMLASGIFVMAGVGLALALNNVSKTFIAARKSSHIRMELASRLAEARILPVAPEKKSEKPDAEGVTYEKEVAALEFKKSNPRATLNSNAPLNGFYRITITASWQEGKNPQSEKAEVYVFQP